MSFDIGFVDDHKTVFGAHFEKSRVVGVMRGSHGVAVALLDDVNVTQHMRFVGVIARFGV